MTYTILETLEQIETDRASISEISSYYKSLPNLVSVRNKQMIKLSDEEMAKAYVKKRHGGELMKFAPVGKEIL
jgi:hypothetical protein